MNRIIKNSNGFSYEVLDSFSDYLLLLNTEKNYTPYVVAYNYSEAHESWASGRYYRELESAKLRMEEIRERTF